MKMKSYLLFFLFLIPVAVFATTDSNTQIYSGEEYLVDSVAHCSGNISVLVEASRVVDIDEYMLLECAKSSNTTWSCPCQNPFSIVLHTDFYTINTYNFTIKYMDFVDNGQSSNDNDGGGSYSGGGYTYIRHTKVNKSEPKIIEKADTDVIYENISFFDGSNPITTESPNITFGPPNNTTNPVIVDEVEGSNTLVIILIIIAVIVVGIIVWFFLMR